MLAHRHTGTVYGVVLNDRHSLQKIGSLDEAPYKGIPKSPVLYIKPGNTIVGHGAVVCLPEGESRVEIGATIGVVMGRAASRLERRNAMSAVKGIIVAADLSLPHSSYYRPAIREKCFDGALPMGKLVEMTDVADLSDLTLETHIDGACVERRHMSELLRNPAELLVAVTEFMTLQDGDVLLLGVRYGAAHAGAGSTVSVSAEGIDQLSFYVEARATNRGEMQ